MTWWSYSHIKYCKVQIHLLIFLFSYKLRWNKTWSCWVFERVMFLFCTRFSFPHTHYVSTGAASLVVVVPHKRLRDEHVLKWLFCSDIASHLESLCLHVRQFMYNNFNNSVVLWFHLNVMTCLFSLFYVLVHLTFMVLENHLWLWEIQTQQMLGFSLKLV